MKISDYYILHSILRILSKRFKFDFIDYDIEITKSEPTGIVERTIKINSLSNSLYELFSSIITCILNIQKSKIQNVDFDDVLFQSCAFLRPVLSESDDKIIKHSIRHYPDVWMYLNNIFSGKHNKSIYDIPVIRSSDSLLDCSFYKPGEKDFIYLSSQLKSEGSCSAFLIKEYYIMQFGKDFKDKIKNDFTDFYTSQIAIDFFKTALGEPESDKFFLVLATICSSEQIEEIVINKKAQTALNIGPFWYLGIVEKMLGGHRGYNWEVYKVLEEETNKIKAKRENKRKKSGKRTLSLPDMLSIMAEDFSSDPNILIEKKLAPSRDSE